MIGFVSNDVAPLASGIDNFCLLMEKRGNPPYAYEFARVVPGDDAGAFHSGELWYVFNTLGRSWRHMSNADFALSERMVDNWTNFAKYGNPNGKGRQVWKPFTKRNYHFYKFDIRSSNNGS
jgi:para-nitrobenzyl esterase